MNTSLKSILSTLVLAAALFNAGCGSESESDRQARLRQEEARIRREEQARRAENVRLAMYCVGFTIVGLGCLGALAVALINTSKRHIPFANLANLVKPLPTSTPAEIGTVLQAIPSPAAATPRNNANNPPAPRRSFAIDGTNVCRSYNRGAFRLETLLSLATVLLERGDTFECYFDASTKYAAERAGDVSQREAYTMLLAKYPALFRQTPAGEPADDTILLRANQNGWCVISNDLFNKPEDGHLSRYPWIKIRGRVLRGSQYNARLVLAQLGIDASVESSLAAALARFEASLNPRTSARPAFN